VISFPNCKINLGLNIIAKRADGFHDIETVFYPVDFRDVLEILPQQNEQTGIDLTITGLPVEGDTTNNLCIKAYHLLKHDFLQLPSIKMHLHKTIPMGAGLGGGSADGAFALKLLNEKFQLGLSIDQLIGYALQLGSDCPFFIINQPCFAGGRGEKLQPIDVDLSAYSFVIVNPGIHINTGWAFSQIIPKNPVTSIKEIIYQPVETWKTALVNDFEEAVFSTYPGIKAIKENLYVQGAVYASMTGSGSTVFGIFEKTEDLAALKEPGCKIFIVQPGQGLKPSS
jgi:4-diphosphocytidyl-2-C-methyl-D-erythritol kinase